MIMEMHDVVPGWLCLPSSGAMPIRLVNENGMTGTIYSSPWSGQSKEKHTAILPFPSRLTIPYKNISLWCISKISLSILYEPLERKHLHVQ